MTNAREHVTTIFDDSTHALKVSFHIMRVILFRHLIIVNCRLYTALKRISKISNVLIYPAVIGKNIIVMIRKAFMTFAKPSTYGEEATSWILLFTVWLKWRAHFQHNT